MNHFFKRLHHQYGATAVAFVEQLYFSPAIMVLLFPRSAFDTALEQKQVQPRKVRGGVSEQ